MKKKISLVPILCCFAFLFAFPLFSNAREEKVGGGKQARDEVQQGRVAAGEGGLSRKVPAQGGTSAEMPNIREVKGPVPPKRGFFPIVAGVLVLGGIGLSVAYAIRKRKGLGVSWVRPPHPTALEALEKLRNENQMALLRGRWLFAELSRIFRQYLQDRFGLEVMSLTTEETVGQLGKRPEISPELLPLIRKFLQEGDAVKFSLHDPSAEEVNAIYTLGQEIIRRTREEGPP